jgi:predicted ATPase
VSPTRRPTPPGPITELFDRLEDLHLNAGAPSMRTIEDQTAISYSTVHAILRGPRVPTWAKLELVVEALGGDREEFLRLWKAARQTQDRLAIRRSAPTQDVAHERDDDRPMPEGVVFAWGDAQDKELTSRVAEPTGTASVNRPDASSDGLSESAGLGVIAAGPRTRPSGLHPLQAQVMAVTGAREPGRLPSPVTPLLGRSAEAEELAQMLGTRRLVTLTGIGGVGKTRLAIDVAERCADDFPDGVVFLDLADITGPDRLVPAVARALNVSDMSGQASLLDTVCGALAVRRTLLVLDNVEPLLPAAARVIAVLIKAGSAARILVTSRERLKLVGEQVYPVPPLVVPDLARLPPDGEELVEAVSAASAVALFVQHARSVTLDFSLSAGNARTVAELCCRLDGLPLAIELAAVRCDRTSLADLLADLSRRLDTLADDAIDRLDRHRTLRAVIDGSFQQLDLSSRDVFARLSVFVSGFSRASAEAIAINEAAVDARARPEDLQATLGVLADRSLLMPYLGHDGERRWRMLETIRAFALEQLDGLGAADGTRRRHLAWYVGLAEAAEPGLRGPDQVTWLTRLDTEYPDLQAALVYGLDHGEPGQATAIASSIWRFWRVRGYLSEGRHWLERCLTAAELAIPDKVKALLGAGALAIYQSDTAAARRHLEAARDAALATGELRSAAVAHNLLGSLANAEANYAEALTNHEQSLSIGRRLGDQREIAIALANLGEAAALSGDLARARQLTEEGLPFARTGAETRHLLIVLINLGNIARREGKLEEARQWLREALPLARSLADNYLLAWVLVSLGLVGVRDADPRATDLLRAGVLLRHDLGDREGVATALEGFAAAFVDSHPDRAAFLIGAAEALRHDAGTPVPPADRASYDELLARVHAGLGDAFDAKHHQGARAPLTTVLAAVAGQETAEHAVDAVLAQFDVSARANS